MSDFHLTTPVAFIIFNRPDLTQRVFEEIRRARPPKLFLIADGPRLDRPGEAEKCAAARAVVADVDWDCQVYKNYSDVNLGCGLRPATGISWAFEHVDEAIILEDDCLPHLTFFRFCQELLERFREDDRVFMVSGRNALGEWKSDRYSYFFSTGGTWGWATWRRAWQHFDFDLRLWSDEAAQRRMKEFFKGNSFLIRNLRTGCEAVLSGKVDAWDYQWAFTRAVYHGMSVCSSVNLVSNIGFREDATHTKTYDPIQANVKLGAMKFPLKHHNEMYIDFEYYEAYDKLRERLPLRLGRYLGKLLALSRLSFSFSGVRNNHQ